MKKNSNSSILNFFKKADGPPQSQSRQPRLTQFGVVVSKAENGNSKGNGKDVGLVAENLATDGLFVEDKNRKWKNLVDIRDEGKKSKTTKTIVDTTVESTARAAEEDKSEEPELNRFNENTGSNKRRKTESPAIRGPFIDESDSEDDEQPSPGQIAKSQTEQQIISNKFDEQVDSGRPPRLVRAATSNFETSAVADDSEDIEDDMIGDEFGENIWMQDELNAFGTSNMDLCEEGPACPVCQASLLGQSDAVSVFCVYGS